MLVLCMAHNNMCAPWVGKIPWGRKWQPTPVLLPGKSHGRRTLVGYTVHGVQQRGIYDWATSLSLTVQSLSHVQLFMTPWAVTCQAFLSVGFSRQEYWSGLPFPPPGDPPNPGIELVSPASPWEMDWEVNSLPLSHLGSVHTVSPK